ncbi:hypothetical protein DPMN_027583 [Dreissena polymorpha]|uniref:Uncharacterized protein n=1 Tax=Dreissena polymorpha TaxID=45954 RepID=A0A9D4LVH6_DREPO|nr:hypothetical protein DPMN_027583 [Dreissena polymorpha]
MIHLSHQTSALKCPDLKMLHSQSGFNTSYQNSISYGIQALVTNYNFNYFCKKDCHFLIGLLSHSRSFHQK